MSSITKTTLASAALTFLASVLQSAEVKVKLTDGNAVITLTDAGR
jgi:hypothetical protein